MNTRIFPSFYAAPIAYYAELLRQPEQPVLEIHEHFTKQTYRNRMHIYSAHGLQKLTVPVEKNASKTPLKDLRISYAEKWYLLHWRALQSSYQSSPYFEFYSYLFEPLFSKPAEFLLDQNLAIHYAIEKCLEVSIPLVESSSYVHQYPIDYRLAFNTKNKTAMDQGWQTYQQVFSYEARFLPNLSILDALFNLGPETRSYLINGKVELE